MVEPTAPSALCSLFVSSRFKPASARIFADKEVEVLNVREEERQAVKQLKQQQEQLRR